MRRLLLGLICSLAVAGAANGQTEDLLGGYDGPSGGRAEPGGARRVVAELDRAGRALGGWRYAAFDQDVITLLAPDEPGHRETFLLTAGRQYVFQGVCDRNCGDIDLEILDASGAVVARDGSDARWPQVSVTPAQSGRFVVHVWIKRCAQDYCFAGVRGYGRPN